jgi:hypothetical protein
MHKTMPRTVYFAVQVRIVYFAGNHLCAESLVREAGFDDTASSTEKVPACKGRDFFWLKKQVSFFRL